MKLALLLLLMACAYQIGRMTEVVTAGEMRAHYELIRQADMEALQQSIK